MARYIDCDLINTPELVLELICYDDTELEAMLKCFPTANVREIIYAEWKRVKDPNSKRYYCTNCQHIYGNKEYKFCPFCGAEMHYNKSHKER